MLLCKFPTRLLHLLDKCNQCA